MADQKATALSEVSIPEFEDVGYAVEDPSGTPTSRKLTKARDAGLMWYGSPMGRLTTESGVPVSTTDRLAQGTIYYKPCTVNGMPLTNGVVKTYDGTRRRVQEFSQVSLALTVTSGKNYDVFQKDSDLSLVLSSAWTTDTVRADSLALVKDLIVANADNTYLWVGTVRASGANVTADSIGNVTTQVGGKRFVWNAYNRVRRHMFVFDSEDQWDYTTATYRVARGATAPLNCNEYVCGDLGDMVTAEVIGGAFNAGGVVFTPGVGIDGVTNVATPRFGASTTVSATIIAALYKGYPGLGYHSVRRLEISGASGTTTFYGDAGNATIIQTGMLTEVMA